MRKITGFFLFLLLLSPASLFAESKIGVLKKVEGEVLVLRGELSLPGVVGMTLFEEDLLKTGPHGAVGIVMNDDTTLSLGPQSELSLKEYVFDPKSESFSVVLRMLKGTFVYMSGIIGKLAPDSIRLETPDSTIAVRGTRLLIKVND
jgi:hypothetical protein